MQGEPLPSLDVLTLLTKDSDMWKQEGVKSFYKGITPRVMRVAPGQAVTFTVYEYLKGILEKGREMIPGGQYEE